MQEQAGSLALLMGQQVTSVAKIELGSIGLPFFHTVIAGKGEVPNAEHGDRLEVFGLTTAASIWLTAGIGVGAGLGHLWLPILGAAIGWFILGPIARIEKRRSSKGTEG